MNEQERMWAGEFGNQYLTRNRVDWITRARFWREIVALTGARTFLEVGCNAGWNLSALRMVSPSILLDGIDVNANAAAEARNCGFGVEIMTAQEFAVVRPLDYDLVFTAGCLIHVPPIAIDETMMAIASMSRRYVLAVEYFAEQEEDIEYRGQHDRLWRRPYGKMYENLGLKAVDGGFLGEGSGFDNCHWWLLEKQ